MACAGLSKSRGAPAGALRHAFRPGVQGALTLTSMRWSEIAAYDFGLIREKEKGARRRPFPDFHPV